MRILNGGLLELNFSGQTINCCSQLDCKKVFLNYLFFYWIYLFLFLFICIYYLFIDIFIHWYSLWMRFVNSINCEWAFISNYLYWICFIKILLFKDFYISVIAYVLVCVFLQSLCAFMCCFWFLFCQHLYCLFFGNVLVKW